MITPDIQPQTKPTCACVHHDAYECARLRDRRSNGYDEDNDYYKRACECCCHKDDDDEPDDL